MPHGSRPSRTSAAVFPSASAPALAAKQPRYSIIVPAYNEHERVGATLQQILGHVSRENWDAEVIVVDDGSRDDTVEIAGRFAAQTPWVRILHNPGNQGKGYSVRHGVLQARGQMLLFTDADLSSPISEAAKLFAALESGADIAIGSRWLDPAFQFRRQSPERRALSRVYNLFLRMALRLPYRDTQCGFKAFTSMAAALVFPRQRIMRWGFDAEILHLADRLGLRVAEVPVAWGHRENSRLHPWRDGLRMAWDALKVRAYSLTGQYRLLPSRHSEGKNI
jgi:glycosyltransferase involved in cell wall biosynthesis